MDQLKKQSTDKAEKVYILDKKIINDIRTYIAFLKIKDVDNNNSNKIKKLNNIIKDIKYNKNNAVDILNKLCKYLKSDISQYELKTK